MASTGLLLRLSLPAVSLLLPRPLPPTLLIASAKLVRFWAHRLASPLLPSAVLAALALPSISLGGGGGGIPSLLADIWESVLRAVPKKKTSYKRTRTRQMAGKALKDVTAICRCPGCGQLKRMHRLCPECYGKIRDMWREDNPSGTFL